LISSEFVPFNKPYIHPRSLKYLSKLIDLGDLQGEGTFTKNSEILIQKISKVKHVLMTPSCTDALEMAYMLIGLKPGDEVIMPSFNFTSAAIAAVKLGGTPVFVDIEPRTLNISIEEAMSKINKKTRAITFLNYAGYGSDLKAIRSELNKKGIYLIEDNAHGFGGRFKDINLGTIGDISVQSFHSTKNIQCGEGGAISFSNDALLPNAQIIRQKGTNRHDYNLKKVSKYSWVGQGSSYLASELQAAVLYTQLQEFNKIQDSRNVTWFKYMNGIHMKDSRLPLDNEMYTHTSHIFYMLLPTSKIREDFIQYMKKHKIQTVSHYEPLHNSIAGKKYGKSSGAYLNTINISQTIVRLPIWKGLPVNSQNRIIDLINNYKAS
jgi:dTDP-4-amino-4,6-dideoxygalactose transaminase